MNSFAATSTDKNTVYFIQLLLYTPLIVLKFSSSRANLNAAKINKKPLRGCLCSIVDFVMKNCPPLLVAAGHGFLANTVSKNLFQ